MIDEIRESGQITGLLIDVSELRKSLGQKHSETFSVCIPAVQVIDSRSSGDEITGEVQLQSIDRGISLSGVVSFDWVGDCRRCLEPTVGSVTSEFSEVFYTQVSEGMDASVFDGSQVDILPVIRDAIASSIPLVPLCDSACLGPDPQRYPTLLGEVAVSEDRADPRWDALNDLTFE